MLKGLVAAVQSTQAPKATGQKVDPVTSLVVGAMTTVTSYANDMGLTGGVDAYAKRAKRETMSERTAAMTRLGLPMTECDQCGSSMSQPPIDAIYEANNFHALWVCGHTARTEEGTIYFLCSPECHKASRIAAVQEGYQVR